MSEPYNNMHEKHICMDSLVAIIAFQCYRESYLIEFHIRFNIHMLSQMRLH